MKRLLIAAGLISALAGLHAHGFGNPPTWNREISRLMYDRCVSCHRDGGTAFSLMTYADVQPRAVAVRDAVLSRKMPPWGAVKGFGDFRNDQGLSQEQIELFSDWVNGGIRKGNNPNVLPDPPKFDSRPSVDAVEAAAALLTVREELTLDRPVVVEGLLPEHVLDGSSAQIVATLPDGRVEPLVWFYEYQDRYRHPFLFRRPLSLPAGTRVRGASSATRVQLLLREGS